MQAIGVNKVAVSRRSKKASPMSSTITPASNPTAIKVLKLRN